MGGDEAEVAAAVNGAVIECVVVQVTVEGFGVAGPKAGKAGLHDPAGQGVSAGKRQDQRGQA